MKSECLITGCKLVLTNEHTMCHGDLFVLGHDTFIYNAVVGGEYQAECTYDIDPDAHFNGPLYVVAVDSNDCWERRGTFVFHRASCRINKAALEYIGDRLP